MRDRSPQALWEAALGQLELQVTRPNFDTWLRNTVGLEVTQDRIVVGVPSDFCVEWLRSRMGGVVDRIVTRIHGGEITAVFQVLGAPALESPGAEVTAKPATRPAQARTAPDLDARLTFATFTPAGSNRVAFRAAKRAANGEASFNPLVLHGPPGLGKTHLLHAIGHEAAKAGRQIVALTGEAFVDRYSNAVRFGKPHVFRETFEGCEVLLLDDIGFLASRTASQEQFFHIFNALHGNGSLVVVTANVRLESIAGLSDRLLSRLGAGLELELSPLTGDDQRQILEQKIRGLEKQLPPHALDAIASKSYRSVRALEGAINRAAAYSDLSDAPVSKREITNALDPLGAERPPTPQQILDLVSKHFDVSMHQMAGASRARDITYARHIAMYLLRHHSARPLTEIGQLLGGRDHSTVLHACRRIERENASLPQTREDIELLEATLGSSDAA